MSTWTVAHPAVLLVAPVAILAVVAATRRSVSSLPRWRRLVSGAVRTAAVLLLTFSMVGPSLTQRREQPALTVFLADVSESIPPDAWGKALPELRQAWSREISRGNRCALVAFAGRSQVLVPPGTGPLPEDLSRLSHRAEVERLSAAGDPKAGELRAWAEQIHAVATDFPQALATARALFQEGTTNRIVLVTDGRTPLRAARDIEMPPGTLGIRLEGVPRQDVAVVGVSAPTGVRAGEPFDVGVTLHTTAPGNVSLRLLAGRESQLEMETTFAAPSEGRHLIVLKNVQQKHPFAPGLQPLHVLAQAENDAEPRNNLGTAVVTVSGKPRVLLVEGTAAEAEPLARMLAAQDIDLVREPAARLAERSSFEEFVAVILAGVPPGLLGSETVGTLSKYVAQTGGGLLVAGSTALKGRGYARSEFEKRLLPVAFLEETPPAAAAKIEPKDTPAPPRPPAPPDPGTGDVRQVLSPTLAILFIVDKSGSMTGDAIEIVKKSCIGSAHNLTAKDSMAVIAFDVRPHLILPFTEGDRQAFIEQTVSRLYADGGTHIYPALVEGLRAFRNDARARQAAVKHAILLSDGDAPHADFKSITLKMVEEGITVSTVCIGCGSDNFDAPLMSRIADWGQGRFIFASSLKQVPNIFAQETRRVLGKIPRETKPPTATPPPQPAAPPPAPAPAPPPDRELPVRIPVVVRDPHEILQRINVQTLPALKGILPATVRPGPVEVPLATTEGKPVLSLWRVGLGKVAVWTSDLSGAWSAEWVAWKESGKLFAQLVRHLYSASPDAALADRVSVRTQASEALIRIDAGPEGERLLVREAGKPGELPLGREPDGSWTLRAPLDRNDLCEFHLDRGDGKPLRFGAVRAYESEFGPTDAEHDLFGSPGLQVPWSGLRDRLEAPRTSTDRRQDVALWALLGALLLLPLDVGLRRLSA